MKLSNFILVLITVLIVVFSIYEVSAISVSYGEWEDESTSARINQGESISFNYYFYQSSSSMDIKIDLFDNYGNLIHNFLDETVSESYYYNENPIQITSLIYESRGGYFLTFSSEDSDKIPSIMSISLIVENQPPVITSSPITKINKEEVYSYQVIATDADGGDLTYSFITSPSWLSIDSFTGLVTGTAPKVDSDESYSIKIAVSDGIDYTTQEYTLTVKDIPDTIPPSILLETNLSVLEFGIDSIKIIWTIEDNKEIDSLTVSIMWPEEKVLVISSVNIGEQTVTGERILSPSDLNLFGIYNISIWATDVDGNENFEYKTFEVVDTTLPEINVKNIKDGNIYYHLITEIDYSVSDNHQLDSCRYNLGEENKTVTCGEKITDIESKEGSNTWTIYAKDVSGNLAKEKITFFIKLDLDDKDDEKKIDHQIHDYTVTPIPKWSPGEPIVSIDEIDYEEPRERINVFRGISGLWEKLFNFVRDLLNRIFYS